VPALAAWTLFKVIVELVLVKPLGPVQLKANGGVPPATVAANETVLPAETD
jgi:hypothetical protein